MGCSMKALEQYLRREPRQPLTKDVRVQELLRALNERILPPETVHDKVCSIAGSPIHFYQYRDGSYYICD